MATFSGVRTDALLRLRTASCLVLTRLVTEASAHRLDALYPLARAVHGTTVTTPQQCSACAALWVDGSLRERTYPASEDGRGHVRPTRPATLDVLVGSLREVAFEVHLSVVNEGLTFKWQCVAVS